MSYTQFKETKIAFLKIVSFQRIAIFLLKPVNLYRYIQINGNLVLNASKAFLL